MPGTPHILDRIPQHTTDTNVPEGAIPQVQPDTSVAWGPALASQVEGYVPRVQAGGSVVWELPLGATASPIADPAGVAGGTPSVDNDVEARAAISDLANVVSSILGVLRTKGVIAA